MKLLLVLSFFFIASTARAATPYYVDCNTGQDANTGTSISSAWKSLSPIRSRSFSPGDTIYLLRGCSWDAGTSSSGWVIDDSGTQSQPILITDYGQGALPRITNSYAGSLYIRGIEIRADWVTLQNIRVTDVKEKGIFIDQGSTHVTLSGLEIANVGQGIEIQGTYNKVLHSTIHDLHMIVNTPGGDDDYGSIGVMIVGSNNEIAFNHIYNCIAPSYDYGVDGAAVEFFGYGNLSTAADNSIHHNRIENNAAAVEFGSTNNAVFSENNFFYNLFINNGLEIWFNNSGSFGAQITNTSFWNNTIYENPAEYTFASNRGSPWRVIGFSQAPTPITLSFINNIVSTQGYAQFATHGTFTHTHNLYRIIGGSVGYTLASGELQVDPLFISATTHNFHLQSTSPAINRGMNVGLTSDFDSTLVPNGIAPDIGAYELIANRAGDANGDGRVDGLDYIVWLNHYNQTVGGVTNGDYNGDGRVDGLDYVVWITNYGR